MLRCIKTELTSLVSLGCGNANGSSLIGPWAGRDPRLYSSTKLMRQSEHLWRPSYLW